MSPEERAEETVVSKAKGPSEADLRSLAEHDRLILAAGIVFQLGDQYLPPTISAEEFLKKNKVIFIA